MSKASSLMKKSLLSLSIASISLCSSISQAEQAPLKKAYQEPTRGFFLEHGSVANQGQASVELNSGSDDLNSAGGIRLGLSGSELLLNTGLDGYDENSALLKWSLPRQNAEGTESTPIIWSALAGISHLDIDGESGTGDKTITSLTLGVAATVQADAGTFTVAPKLVFSNIDDETTAQDETDTYFELDLGAYVGIIETKSGLFSVGAEALITTADDTDNTIALGGRWLYNERLNLDFVPIIFSDSDLIGLPGLVRLNVSF